METAIKKVYRKVMEQGFIPLPQQEIDGEWVNDEADYLRPEFWQALGKACGWKGTEIRQCIGCGVALKHNQEHCKCGDECIWHFAGQWLIEWHRFIDHLAEGKDADSFFNELLK